MMMGTMVMGVMAPTQVRVAANVTHDATPVGFQAACGVAAQQDVEAPPLYLSGGCQQARGPQNNTLHSDAAFFAKAPFQLRGSKT